MSLRRPPSEAVPVESKQNLTDGDARWKIPECWRDESHESHRKKCQLNSTACPTRSNASVSEGWEQRGSKCPIRLPHAQVDSELAGIRARDAAARLVHARLDEELDRCVLEKEDDVDDLEEAMGTHG